MEDVGLDYLSLIPDELKIEIFSYLATIDIVHLWQIPPFEHLSYDKSLISNISLYKEYQCKLDIWNKFVSNKLRSDVITSLNINCIYWIPAKELRKGIKHLQMLESLYAVDTKLALTVNDSAMYNSLTHLKHLAVTILDRELETGAKFPSTLVNLYLHLEVIQHESVSALAFLVSQLKFLDELWVIDLSPASAQITVMRLLTILPNSLTKLTIMFHRGIDLALVNTINIKGILTFKTLRKDMMQLSYEKIDIPVKNIYKNWDFNEDSWKNLVDRLKYTTAFGRRDAKRLILGKSAPDSLEYEEMNITHAKDLCSILMKLTAALLLTAPNMSALKKLSINFCMCEQGSNEMTNKVEPLFKKARVGVSHSLPKKSTLEKIIENSPLIEELEIWSCIACNLSKITTASLCSIQNLKNLNKLTLHSIPEHIDGQFLMSICQSCEKLSSLRIKTSKGNNNLHNYLCMALPYATALKDFRYERSYIPIDKLIDSLNESRNMHLDRLVVKCRSIEKFSVVPFETYLSNNPQLKFLCIIIKDVPKHVIRDISKNLIKYKNSPEKVFVVTNDESSYIGRLPIPHVHRREMLTFNTAVSCLNIFNSFTESY